MDMIPTEFHFIRPWWLLALLPAALLAMLALRQRLRRGNWTEVCDAALLPFILQDRDVGQSRWPLILATAAAITIIVALAGPTWERLPAPVFRNDSGLVIALDLSRSMNAADVRPSRLSRARFKIADILKQRKDGLTALLVFAGDAFTVTPLTRDTETIASQLNALKTEIMPSQGSNATAALTLAVDLLKQVGLRQGDILLVGDDVAENAIEQASSILGPYRLSVLGVGSEEGAPIKAVSGGFVKDAEGNIVVAKLESGRLAAFAAAGSGIYRGLSADDSDIEALLASVDRPDAETGGSGDELKLEQWNDKGPWLVLLALPLAALCFRKGLLGMLLFLILPFPRESQALEWRDLWQTRDQQAQQAFRQEQYEQAAEHFATPEWKGAAQYKAGQYQQAAETLQAADSADGHYNRGNALARAGQLQQALEAYRQALDLDPGNEDARFNKELVEKALQQQQQNQSQSGENDNASEDGEQQPSGQQDGEQKSEESDERQQSDESATDDEQQQEPSEQQAEQKQENPAQSETDEASEESEPQSAEQAPMNESEQADEQWLKRIPDDPSGLLKRKFKFQYGQRGRKPNRQDQTW